MTEFDAHEATMTYTCLHPGCPNEVKSSRGPYSKCDVHRGSPARPKAQSPPKVQTTEQDLRGLVALAREVDKLRAKAAALTRQALVAKQAADDKLDEYQRQLALIGRDTEHMP